MLSIRTLSNILLAAGAAALLPSCGGSDDNAASEPPGRWTTGDLHLHTVQSDDSRTTQTLDVVLDKALTAYGLDWMQVSNHLRSSKYDNDAHLLPTPVAFAYGMEAYEIPRIKALQAAGTYADKLVFSGFECDMPTHDHLGVGIFEGGATLVSSPNAAKEFQYEFTTVDEAQFDPADVARWKAKYTQRYNTTSDDALRAIAWLKDNHAGTSIATLNHPSRNPGKYTVADLRQMNDLAPDILFSIEGMVGNQMEPDRGGYTSDYIAANAPNRTYGGVDAIVAKVGGTWDALLGEGRHVWNIADSDSHFEIDANDNSSGYFPGEYAKNHVWVADSAVGIAGLIRSLRDGRSFGTFGDLIDALDFHVTQDKQTAQMGQELAVGAGQTVTVTIRFKSPALNNYQHPVASGIPGNRKPVVDHVDLIVGDVTAKAAPGTPAYAVPTNAATHVLKRFTAADWTVGADGYATASVQVTAGKSEYFRLRGTNLAPDVPGLMAQGEPLADQKTTAADDPTRLNAINDRNYDSLWFYSNPVFVTVR